MAGGAFGCQFGIVLLARCHVAHLYVDAHQSGDDDLLLHLGVGGFWHVDAPQSGGGFLLGGSSATACRQRRCHEGVGVAVGTFQGESLGDLGLDLIHIDADAVYAGTVVAVAHGLIHEVAGELEGVQQAQSCLEVLDGGLLPGIADVFEGGEFLVDEAGEVGDVAQLASHLIAVGTGVDLADAVRVVSAGGQTVLSGTRNADPLNGRIVLQVGRNGAHADVGIVVLALEEDVGHEG